MNFNGNRAIYLQIAENLTDRIAIGELKPGCRLPSVRDLSVSYEVNVNTVMRSVDYLQLQEVVYNKRGIGYFVSDDAVEKVIKIKRRNFMTNEIGYFFKELSIIGVTPTELSELYDAYLKKEN